MLRRVSGIIWPSWLVFVVSAAVYLVLLYLSKPFSTPFESGCEWLAAGFALLAAGEVVIGAVCTWLKASARRQYQVRMLAGLAVVAIALALPAMVSRHAYHQRWMFVFFSVFGGGWYTLLWGWSRLPAAGKTKP